MKNLTYGLFLVLFAMTSCSHFGGKSCHKGAKHCSKEKKACCKEKKECCKKDKACDKKDKKDCKDGSCKKSEDKPKS